MPSGLGPIGITVVIVATIGLIVALTACAKGEEPDWKRLVEALEKKDALLQGGGHLKFPDYRPDKAADQVKAIRAFAKAYPKSDRIDRILRAYLLPHVWRDVERGGIDIGSWQLVSLLAWEVHQAAPERRPGFAEVIEAALSEVPDSGHLIAQVGEELGDAGMAKRGKARKTADRKGAQLARRKDALAALAKAREPAQKAMRELLLECDGPRDRISIEVTGFKAGWEGVLEDVRVELADDLQRQAGLWSTTPNHDTKDPIKASLVVQIAPEERPMKVVVQQAPTTSTRTERTLERRWTHGTQDWRTHSVEREVTTQTGGGPSAETYPVLTAEVALGRPDTDPLWTKEGVTSDWQWVQSKETPLGYAPATLEEGAEVPSDVWSYSAGNLAGRIAHQLLGPAFKRGLQ